MNTTDFLAIYGSILGTVGTLLSAMALLRDNGKLELSIYVGNIISGPIKDSNRLPNYICITVTNVGRRPMVVSGIDGLVRRNWFEENLHARVLSHNISNSNLIEGAFIQDQMLLTKESQESFGKFKQLWVTDSVGRKFRLKRKMFRRFLKDLKEARTASIKRDSIGSEIHVLDAVGA